MEETTMTKHKALPFVLMRGGTSKGVFLRAEDVPQEREELIPLLLDLFGSPDRRQIDGLGGADKLTSKVAIIGKPVMPGSDLTYLFGQVGMQAPEVDFKLNCGNLTAAVGMYAIQEGLVEAVEGITTVRIHNVNTGKIIYAAVPVRDGEPVVEGDLAIGGVPGTGAPIALDFSRATGALTGKLLPLGAPAVALDVPGHGSIEVSVVDGANLVVFVAAESLGMTGTETPDEIDGNKQLTAKIDAIRRQVAHRVGMGDYWESRAVPSNPMCVVVQRPGTYKTFSTGAEIRAESIDLLCRQYSTGATSKAMAATVTSCTGVACRIAGTIPSRFLSERAASRELIEIGHPSGIIGVESNAEPTVDGYQVHSAKILRTARRIAEGKAYLKGKG
jgi:2-methylaconitate cis-trans-isomerase PrpF